MRSFGRDDRVVLPALVLPFLALALTARISQPTAFDRWLGDRLQLRRWGRLSFLPRFGSEFGGGWLGFYVVPLATAGALTSFRRWKLLGLLALAFALHYVVIAPKLLIRAHRPSLAFGIEGAGGLKSFPSGHTQWATSFYGLLAFVAWRELPQRTRWLVIPAYALLVLLTMLGRVALGRHWPTDTVAGVFAGLLTLRILGALYGRCYPRGDHGGVRD